MEIKNKNDNHILLELKCHIMIPQETNLNNKQR